VILHALDDLKLVEEPLDKTWSRFFPTVSRAQARNYRTRRPTRKSSAVYIAEPLEPFLQGVRLFATVIQPFTVRAGLVQQPSMSLSRPSTCYADPIHRSSNRIRGKSPPDLGGAFPASQLCRHVRTRHYLRANNSPVRMLSVAVRFNCLPGAFLFRDMPLAAQ
jgi:hypothetical protein